MWNSSVELSVVDKLELPCESGTAVGASERINGSVESRMHVEMLLLCEALTAIFADVRALTSVELAVSHQVAF